MGVKFRQQFMFTLFHKLRLHLRKMQAIAKTLIIFGVVLIGIGVLLNLANKIPFIGRLPGDIYIQKKNFSFYFPITTSILISIILSLIFWLWPRR